jgi:hypothetical protein
MDNVRTLEYFLMNRFRVFEGMKNAGFFTVIHHMLLFGANSRVHKVFRLCTKLHFFNCRFILFPLQLC